MVAGALTGALFKSTGERSSRSILIHSQRFHFLPSWCEACLGSSYYCLSLRGSVELGEDTRLSTLYLV
jgi:hypothetical protein